MNEGRPVSAAEAAGGRRPVMRARVSVGARASGRGAAMELAAHGRSALVSPVAPRVYLGSGGAQQAGWRARQCGRDGDVVMMPSADGVDASAAVGARDLSVAPRRSSSERQRPACTLGDEAAACRPAARAL